METMRRKCIKEAEDKEEEEEKEKNGKKAWSQTSSGNVMEKPRKVPLCNRHPNGGENRPGRDEQRPLRISRQQTAEKADA